MTTWILVANSAEANLYSSENLRTHDAKLVCEFKHPDSRKKITDLVSDHLGHFKTDSGAHGAFTKGDPKDNEAEHFALELAHELKAGHDQGKFKKLIVVAPGHFYAHISKHMHNNITDITHIVKDYTKYNLSKLNESLKEQLLF